AVPPLRAQETPQSPTPLFDAGMPRLGAEIVGAVRLPAPPLEASRVPASIYVLTAEDLRRSGARTLAEALERLPGVVHYDQVGNGYQPTLDLRGFNATPVPATVVVVDGVRVNEPDFGQVNWQLIALERVERVEVLPGPSTVFGKNALAGVINVVTKRGGDRLRRGVELAGGTYERSRLAASAGGPAGPFDFQISASQDMDEGYRIDSDANLHRAAAKAGWRGRKANLDLDYAFVDDRINQAGSLTAAESGVDRRQNKSAVRTDSLLHALTLNARLAPAPGWSAAANAFFRLRIENTPLNRGRTSVSSSHSGMEGKGAALQVTRESEPGGRKLLVSAGGEFTRQDAQINSGGAFGAFAFGNRTATQDDATGLFAQASVDLLPRTLSLLAGLRYDFVELDYTDRKVLSNSGRRSYQRATPRLGLNWNPSKRLGLYASYAEAFRTPTANEITALGPFGSTPDLRPVKARNLELGARSAGGWGEASLVRPRGGAFEGFLTYAYTEATFRSDFTLDKVPSATQRVRTGHFLPQVPRNRLAAGVSARAKGVTLSVEELCAGSQHVFGDESNAEPRLGGYCLMGAGAAYERGPARFFIHGKNLLDRRYETRGILGTDPVTSKLQRFLVPAPGAELFAGARLRWE
ncbi:MAG: TonB-dependent siderophore receptor, partial [Elusimicrobia bacterium]